ncbi:MAG: hydroxyacid dehydrogenase [Lachnospiraceae bacterium]|nr:hydroxyacid dehydrogenase [Lachnospiraceae bacterium]
MKIAILESLGVPQKELEERMRPFTDEGHEFAVFERTTDPAALCAEAGGAQAVIIANMPFPSDVIRSLEDLKFIDVAFTGVDHVGLDAAREKGIAVSNASGYSNEAVAELAAGMVLSLLRNIPQSDRRCREGGTKDGLVGNEIMGKTVGIVGLGKIGTRSAELFHAFGAEVISASRSVHADAPAYVSQVSLDELLQRADIVILHCPLTNETRGMINAEKLALMKQSAFLINVARGPVVVSQDLADALNEGRIAGAGIDVFDKEPPLDPADPLLHAKNTIVTPHAAFATKESMSLRAQIVFDNLKAWMDGEQKNVIG